MIYLCLTSCMQDSLNSSLQQLLHLMLSRQAGFSCPCSLLLTCQLLPQQCNLQDRTLQFIKFFESKDRNGRPCPDAGLSQLQSLSASAAMEPCTKQDCCHLNVGQSVRAGWLTSITASCVSLPSVAAAQIIRQTGSCTINQVVFLSTT